jgi:hypothetical protein
MLLTKALKCVIMGCYREKDLSVLREALMAKIR